MLPAEKTSHKELLILGLLMVALQYVVSPILPIFSGHVNFILIFLFFICVYDESDKSSIIALLLGLFQDFSGSGPIGLYALVYVCLSLLMQRGDAHLSFAGLREVLVPFCFFCIAGETVYQFLANIVLGNLHIISLVFAHIVPCVLLDIVFFIPAWLLWQRLLGAFAQSGRRGTGSSGYALSSRFKQKR